MINSLKELKIFSWSYILEHDRLTKDEKLQLGNFVKEANENQLHTLLISGHPQSKEISEKFVKENKELISEFDPVAATGGVLVLGGLVLASSLISASYRVYRDRINKHSKRCANYKEGPDKRWCIANVKADAYDGQIKNLQASASKCQKSKDPAKCVGKIKQKVAKLQGKMKVQAEKAKKENKNRQYKEKS